MLELLSHMEWYYWLGGFQVRRKLHRQHWVRPTPNRGYRFSKLSSLDRRKQKKTLPCALNLHSCGGKKKSENKTSAHKHKKKERWKWREKITIAKTVFYVENPENGKKTTGGREGVLDFKREITVVILQVIRCLIFFLPLSRWRRGIYTSWEMISKLLVSRVVVTVQSLWL